MVASTATRSAWSRRATIRSVPAATRRRATARRRRRPRWAGPVPPRRTGSAPPSRRGTGRSPPVGPVCSTASSAARWGSGSSRTASRIGCTSWCNPAYPYAISDSIPTARSTWNRGTASSAARTNADFPMPAGPARRSAPPRPCSAALEQLSDGREFDRATDQGVAWVRPGSWTECAGHRGLPSLRPSRPTIAPGGTSCRRSDRVRRPGRPADREPDAQRRWVRVEQQWWCHRHALAVDPG